MEFLKVILDFFGLILVFLSGAFIFGWLPMMIEEKRGAEVCAAITKLTHKTAEERDFYGSPEGWFSELFSRAAFRISIPENGSVDSIRTMFSAVI